MKMRAATSMTVYKNSIRVSGGGKSSPHLGCRKRQKRLAIALPYAPGRRYIGQPLIPKNGVILHLESARENGGARGAGVLEDFLD